MVMGCKTPWEWYLKPAAQPPNRENMSGAGDGDLTDALLSGIEPMEVDCQEEMPKVMEVDCQEEMPKGCKAPWEWHIKPAAQPPNRENISGDGDLMAKLPLEFTNLDCHQQKRPSAWNEQDARRELAILRASHASHWPWKANSYHEKQYQGLLTISIKAYHEYKALKDALKEEYYGVLKATEGFFMGSLEKFKGPLSGSVKNFSNDDEDAISCAKFALEQLNQEKGEELKLVRLVSVNGLVKFDVMYWLTIEASNGKFYEAKVHDHTPYYDPELVFIRPAVHYPPRSDNAGLLPDGIPTTGTSTCSESDFAPLSPEDYGLPIPPDEAPKSAEDLINSPGVLLYGFNPYQVMKQIAQKKYDDVIAQTEGFYAGSIAKLCPYLPFKSLGTLCNQSPEANEFARFALDTWNTLKGGKLELKRLVKVNSAVFTFFLTIEASDGEFYEAKVVEDFPFTAHPKTKVKFVRRALHYPLTKLRLCPQN